MSDPAVQWTWFGWDASGAGVFHRGTDDRIYQDHRAGASGVWAGWRALPSPMRGPDERFFPTGPGKPAVLGPALSWNQVEVFHRDLDNSLWHIFNDRADGPWDPLAGWEGHEWLPLGGTLMGDPVAAYVPGGQFNVFGFRRAVFHRGIDNACYYRVTNRVSDPEDPSGEWTAWASLGGVLIGDPVVAANIDGRLEVFHRGTDNRLYHRWMREVGLPSSWSAGWESLGGRLAGQPAAVANGTGGTSVFYRDADSRLNYRFFNPQQGSWSNWEAISYGLTSDPSVALGGQIFTGRNSGLGVVYRGSENHVYYGTQDPAAGPDAPWTFTDIDGVDAGDPLVARTSDSWGPVGALYRGVNSALEASDPL